MSEYTEEIKAKLAALRLLPAEERKPAEVTAYYWPAPDGLKVYAVAAFDDPNVYPQYALLMPQLLAELGYDAPLVVRLVPEKNKPFADLPRSASIAEDGADFTFSNLDREIGRLVATHGEGVPVEVFAYWPAVDLLLSLWRGTTKAPKEMSRARVVLDASTGFRSPNMNVPHRWHATSCLFIFGALLSTQEEIDFHAGCPHNAHLSDEERAGALKIGVPGFTDCARATVGDCFARMTLPDSDAQTTRFWPGYEVRPDPINNFVGGRNIPASAVGNASKLADPIRVIIGERLVKAMPLLAYRNEVNTKTPDKGFGAGLFEVGEGPVAGLWNFRMNDVYVGAEHQNLRLGELGQVPTFFSPGINSFSGTAHCFGRIQGNFNENQAASLTASIMCRGLRDLRVYTEPGVYTEQYSTKRIDAIFAALTKPRWGYGNDPARYDIASVVECRGWGDELVSMHAPDGTIFTGARSSCNVELNSRQVQQQITDLCTAGRIGLPHEFQGLEVFTPLREETLDAHVPTFTDEGDDRNIASKGAESSLSWGYTSDRDLINQWTVNFDDSSNGFVETQLIFGDQRAQLRAERASGGRGIKINGKTQPAFGITNYSEAARFGVFLLYLGPLDAGGLANPWWVKFTTWYSEALAVRMYKPIRVINSVLQEEILDYYTSPARAGSFPWFAGQSYEYFRVMKMVRRGDLKVEITAQLYPQDFMARIEDVEQPPPIYVSAPASNPGGRRGEQPEPIGFQSLALVGGRVVARLEESAYA
jgi:hypothetical protein